jgi:phage terminase Nu1 subunit (DNA packaging protein)
VEAAISDFDSIPLTRAQVAWLLGMSDSWVRDRMQAGDLPRPGETAEEYVEAYVNYRLRKAPGAAGGDGSLEEERTRLTKEQADRIEMQNARDRRELGSIPDMTLAVIGFVEASKARLMRVPAIVAKGNEALRQRVETAIADALEDLSATRVEEAMGGGADDDDAPDPDGDDG